MPIIVDAVSYHGLKDVSSITKSHTTSSGADRLMLVNVSTADSGGSKIPTSVTYDGQSLTKIADAEDIGDTNRADLWKLVNPPSGSANVVVTLVDVSSSVVVGIATFEGVEQTTPLGTAATNQGNSGTLTVDVTGTATDDLVWDCVSHKDEGSLTAGSGQTERYNYYDPVSKKITGAGSTEPGNGGSVTMSWSPNDSGLAWSMVAVAIKPVLGYVNDIDGVSGSTIGEINGIEAANIETVNTV